MASTVTPGAIPALQTPKEQFLNAYEQEHATTMRVLRAYPTDKLDLCPAEKCRTARDLAWVFVMERGLGQMVFNDVFASGGPMGEMPKAPDSWDAILGAIEKSHEEFGTLVRSTPDHRLMETVKFFTAPKTLGDVPRIQFAWFMLCDEIHHRGQFSVYLRMAGGKVPSIYGPTADEPWM
ncbi:MAG: DinB family protein [Gemmatimonadaceae bacterium]